MLAICKRELRGLFTSVTGWIFVGVNMAFYGLYFLLNQLIQGYGNIAFTLEQLPFIIIVTAPILSMRIFSEERKNKTDQLILTAPVSTLQIVLGKFLALAACFGICVVLMGISPLLLSFFGEVTYSNSYVALLGFSLYGLTCLAIGMVVSSLTENQIIAAVSSFVLLFIGYVMTNLTQMISSTGNLLTKVLNCYDIYTPMRDFMGGNLNLVHVVYYLSLIVLCIFLTYEGIQKRRWNVSSKKISFSVFSGVTFVLGLVVIVLLNVGVRAIPSTYTALDFTKQGLYSLTDTTKDYLKNVDEDVTIYYYNTKASADETIVKLLTNYKTANSHIAVKYVNPESNPDFGAKYEASDLAVDSVIVEGPYAYKVINYMDLYEGNMDYYTGNYSASGFDGEGQITSAISYVLTKERPVIYALSGHNETPISGNFSEALEKANMELKNLNFLTEDAVPEDAQLLIIHAPQMDFSADDVKKLQAYLDAGGQMMVTVDFKALDSIHNFLEVLSGYGITVTEGLVAEDDTQAYYQSQYYLLPQVSSEEVNGELAGALKVFFPYSVAFSYGEQEGVTYTPLMQSSDVSYVKTFASVDEAIASVNEQAGLNAITKEAGDAEGPFTVGLNVTAESGCNIYLYGSPYAFTDEADSIVSGRNAQLFSQLLVTVTDTDTSENIVVGVKNYDAPTLTVSTYARRMYALLWIGLIPIGSIILGIIIWAMRRRR
ncbi:MAG: Gldg family protein [Lachnospiraceae bacterium]|nr:Gldg family protein [Lachnospiraceae bacterium]